MKKLSASDEALLVAWARKQNTGELAGVEVEDQIIAMTLWVEMSVDDGSLVIDRTAAELVVTHVDENGRKWETRLPRQLPYRRPA